MNFEDEIQTLSDRTRNLIGQIETEEATKTALILPILRALGYDVFNPLEVVPEFTADVGTKKGEKVDYAIFNEGNLSILIECKKIGERLGANHANQLYRYFTVTKARFGILTDGIIYEFYSDLDEKNKMDTKPFFVFDLLAFSDSDLRELRKFGRSKYAEESILSAAHNMKYARLLDAALAKEFETPSDEITRLLASRVYEGRLTSNVLEWMSNLVKESLSRAIRSRVRANLESALDKDKDTTSDETEADNQEKESGIITTPQEIDAFNIIRAISSELTDPERIFMRDSKSYCAVLFDNNNRRTICRLYLDGKQWRVGIFKEKAETKHNISTVTDIFKLSADLKSALSEYL